MSRRPWDFQSWSSGKRWETALESESGAGTVMVGAVHRFCPYRALEDMV